MATRTTKSKAKTTKAKKAPPKTQTNKKTAKSKTVAKSSVAATTRGTKIKKTVKRTSTKGHIVSPEERHQMIEVQAYFIAESRGFAPGDQHQDWLHAERVVDNKL